MKNKQPRIIIEVPLSECEDALRKETPDTWLEIKKNINSGKYRLFRVEKSYMVLHFYSLQTTSADKTCPFPQKIVEVITGVCWGDLLLSIQVMKSFVKDSGYEHLITYACNKPLAKVYKKQGFNILRLRWWTNQKKTYIWTVRSKHGWT